KNADAVVYVNDVITFRQIREERFGRLWARVLGGEAARFGARPAENLRISKQDAGCSCGRERRAAFCLLPSACSKNPPFCQRALHENDVGGVWRMSDFSFGFDVEIAFAE